MRPLPPLRSCCAGLALLAGCAGLPPVAVATSDVRACALAADRSAPASPAACDRAVGDPALAPAQRVASIVNRGIVQMRRQRWQAAEADFDLAIRIAPSLAEAWINKGLLLSRDQARAAEALALLSHGIELGPSRPARAYYARALAYEAMGKLREAYEDLGRAAQLDPQWQEPAEQLKRYKVVRRKVLQG